MRGETDLSLINCEYRDYLAETCRERGVDIGRGFRSEREGWILMMIAAKMGIASCPNTPPHARPSAPSSRWPYLTVSTINGKA